MEQMFIEFVLLVISGVFAVLWYLLRNKDSHQEEQIKILFVKHDNDVSALEALKLRIAENHYPKTELDVKFLSLETTTRDGFKDLGIKFDKLSEALINHVYHGK